MAVASTMTTLAALTLLAGLLVGAALLGQESNLWGPFRREREVKALPLNSSALNAALAFGPFCDLVSRITSTSTTTTITSTEPLDQQQKNLLFSPVGLASSLALLSLVSGSETRSQVLKSLGLDANATEQTVEATLSALAQLEHSLWIQDGDDVQRSGNAVGAEQGPGTEANVGDGDTPGIDDDVTPVGEELLEAARRGQVQQVEVDGAAAAAAGLQMRLLSSLRSDSEPSIDYQSFLNQSQRIKPPAFHNISLESLMKDLQGSDKLVLTSFVHFKGQWEHPFERRHTVRWSFQLNATASAVVPMMFRDNSAELRMLYDTVCSATVVRLPFAGRRLAALFLLPKAELPPLERCLSDGRMAFWLSNLKPGQAEIRIPRFQLKKSYTLEDLLKSSGISSVFSESADFSGILPRRTGKLVMAVHEVSLVLEESDSEEGSDVQLGFSVPPHITFDRPFIVIVYHEVSGVVLLIGKIIDPRDV